VPSSSATVSATDGRLGSSARFDFEVQLRGRSRLTASISWSVDRCHRVTQRRRPGLPPAGQKGSGPQAISPPSRSVTWVATTSASESRPCGLTRRDAALIVGAVAGTAGIGAIATTPVLSSRRHRGLDKPAVAAAGSRVLSSLARHLRAHRGVDAHSAGRAGNHSGRFSSSSGRT
jgi:hypothetical protein